MKTNIYLRALKIEDASTSYKWRNIPEIWKYTKFRPKEPISAEIEEKWLLNCYKKDNECRRAICLRDTHEYIGNVQIVDIENSKGVFHLFIGNKSYWGKGIGKDATSQILKIGFNELRLEMISLEVHTYNTAALHIYKKFGFTECSENEDFIEMALSRSAYNSITTSTSSLVTET
ncbi:GNAT family N-acetyltransferase [Desertivirga arenae]|uniref:GNAT family N-acetyltransferase n=1 Tax=Desertivirga arenae TaxID=2810309 RepID=UPI001A966C15|nr:GNAT family N-acetyltransferase [Pedobacter sp. SYSU D00823]